MSDQTRSLRLGWPSILCLASLMAGTLMAGCIMPNPPPSQSLAKFVRDPPSQAKAGGPGSRGRVSVGSGVAVYETKAKEPNEEAMTGSIYLFPVEGSLSLFLGERYDLSFSVSSSLLLGMDGNLALLATPRLRLGLLHGIGLGLTGCAINCRDEESSEKWGGVLAYNVSVGLMSQIEVGRSGALFMGARYGFASHAELGYGEDDSEDR